MSKAYILYNPKAGSGSIQDDLDALEVIVDDDIVFVDLTKSEMPQCVLTELEEDDYIILCGGDGTVNRFVNELDGVDIPNGFFAFLVAWRTALQRNIMSNMVAIRSPLHNA